jgi:hypothetical protein
MDVNTDRGSLSNELAGDKRAIPPSRWSSLWKRLPRKAQNEVGGVAWILFFMLCHGTAVAGLVAIAVFLNVVLDVVRPRLAAWEDLALIAVQIVGWLQVIRWYVSKALKGDVVEYEGAQPKD